MITFKDFLTESRSAPLYHASGSGLRILKSGIIKPFTTHTEWKLLKKPFEDAEWSVGGISATRNYIFAKNWALNKMEIQSAHKSMFVFELDQRKLTNRYQIKPIQYWVSSSFKTSSRRQATRGGIGTQNEFEEFIITEHPIKIDTYVTKVYYKISDDFKHYIEKYEAIYPRIQFIPMDRRPHR